MTTDRALTYWINATIAFNALADGATVGYAFTVIQDHFKDPAYFNPPIVITDGQM